MFLCIVWCFWPCSSDKYSSIPIAFPYNSFPQCLICSCEALQTTPLTCVSHSDRSNQAELGVPRFHRLQRRGAPGRGRYAHRWISIQGTVQVSTPCFMGGQEIRPAAPEDERRVRQPARQRGEDEGERMEGGLERGDKMRDGEKGQWLEWLKCGDISV